MVALGGGDGSARGWKGEQRRWSRCGQGGGSRIARLRGEEVDATGKKGKREGGQKRGGGARWRGRNIPSDGGGERGGGTDSVG